MKSLEEKARDYAIDMNERCDGFFNCRSLVDAYLAGAKEALTSKWRRPEDDLPIGPENVLLIISCRHPEDNRLFHFYWTGTYLKGWGFSYGESTLTSLGYSDCRITHWMPVPEVPKDLLG